MIKAPYELDVRPILSAGGEPFSAIMAAVAALEPGQCLKLVAPFKPVPLFQVMAGKGFQPDAREIGGGDWEVLFTPQDAPAGAQVLREDGEDADSWPEPVLHQDNRELLPPEPLERVLSGLETLRPGQTMSALLPREPLFLFDELQARGHIWRGSLLEDGSYRIEIRAGAGA